VGAEHDYSPQLEKLLQKGKGGGPKQRRILELNADHPVVGGLVARFGEAAKGAAGEAAPADSRLDDYAHLLLGYAYLAEGSELPDAARFNRSLTDLLSASLGGGESAAPAGSEPAADSEAVADTEAADTAAADDDAPAAD